MIKAVITDGVGSAQNARVTPLGQVVVAPLSYSTPHFAELNTISTAFNLVEPREGQRFVVTDVLWSTGNNVGQNGATVDIYEAVAVDEASITTQMFRVIVAKQDSVPYPGQNLLTTEGVWINAKTDDNTVEVTLSGYFVKNTALATT